MDKLKAELRSLTKRDVQVNIFEIKRPELEAKLVADMIARRPCSVSDIAGGLGIHLNEAAKHIEELMRQGKISAVNTDKGVYYKSN